MFAALHLAPSLAFLLLSALVIGAAIPLALAWARVLPEEPPPFRIDRAPKSRTSEYAHRPEGQNPRRDPLAIALLLSVTFSYAQQLPGFPRNFSLDTLPTVIPQDAFGWIEFGLIWFFVTVPGFAAAYSLVRPNFLRIPLIAAGVLVPLLWLLAPPLRAALTAVS